MYISVNPGLGGRDHPDLGMGSWGVARESWGSQNIAISYNVQKYEMKTCYKVVTFKKNRIICA